MPKPFTTYQDQLNKLENEKGLIISDKTFAEDVLKRISYFALIGGYKHIFKNKTTGKYIDNTKFEDILELYLFDELLRELFLKYIMKIERNMKSLISYYFTLKYGENQVTYLDRTNYNRLSKFDQTVTTLIDDYLRPLASTSRNYSYINHQRSTHSNVPLWTLVNALTFGTLSKMYSVLTQDVQINISRNFQYVNESDLRKYLSVITKFRNVCAHNERLFSYKIIESIPNTCIHSKLQIPMRGLEYRLGKNDLFAIVISLRYLLPNDEFKKFKRELGRIIDKYIKNKNSSISDELLQNMGFPKNWKNISKYKLK